MTTATMKERRERAAQERRQHAAFVHQCQREAAAAAAWQCAYAKHRTAHPAAPTSEAAAAADRARRACKGERDLFEQSVQSHDAYVRECARLEHGIRGASVADVQAACRALHPDVYDDGTAVRPPSEHLASLSDAVLDAALSTPWVANVPNDWRLRDAVAPHDRDALSRERRRRDEAAREARPAAATATADVPPTMLPLTMGTIGAALRHAAAWLEHGDGAAAPDGLTEHQARLVRAATAAGQRAGRAQRQGDANRVSAEREQMPCRRRQCLDAGLAEGAADRCYDLGYGDASPSPAIPREPAATAAVPPTTTAPADQVCTPAQPAEIVVATAAQSADPTAALARKDVYTTGEVAKVCQVAPRTVAKWFDSGRLGGYRVPGSNDRRIPRDKLVRFLRDNSMPVPPWLEDAPTDDAPAPQPLACADDVVIISHGTALHSAPPAPPPTMTDAPVQADAGSTIGDRPAAVGILSLASGTLGRLFGIAAYNGIDAAAARWVAWAEAQRRHWTTWVDCWTDYSAATSAPIDPPAVPCDGCAALIVRRDGDTDEGYSVGDGRTLCRQCHDDHAAVAVAPVQVCTPAQPTLSADAADCGATPATPEVLPTTTAPAEPVQVCTPAQPADDVVCRTCQHLWHDAAAPCCGRCTEEEAGVPVVAALLEGMRRSGAPLTCAALDHSAAAGGPADPVLCSWGWIYRRPCADGATVRRALLAGLLARLDGRADVELDGTAAYVLSGAAVALPSAAAGVASADATADPAPQGPSVRQAQAAACAVGPARTDAICGPGGLSGASADALASLVAEAAAQPTTPASPPTTIAPTIALEQPTMSDTTPAPTATCGDVVLSNPRRLAILEDYPLGGSKRGRCTFEVHDDPHKGTRVSRVTTGKPKYTTYGGAACIVDGSDGRTYVVSHAGHPYRFVHVRRSDFLDSDLIPSRFSSTGGGSCHPESNPELFAALSAMIAHANA